MVSFLASQCSMNNEIIYKRHLVWVDEKDVIHEHIWDDKIAVDNNHSLGIETLANQNDTQLSSNDPTQFWLAWNERKQLCVREGKNGTAEHQQGCVCFEGLGSVM